MATNTTSSYLNRKTPGVYITEIQPFGASIIGVATAIPVFIGYTEFASDPVSGAALYNTPVALSSMADFTTYFGGAAAQPYAVAPAPATATPAFGAEYTDVNPDPDGVPFMVKSIGFSLTPVAPSSRFNLFWQMRLFFANGGGQCYVVSVGSYWVNQSPVAAPDPVPETWLTGAIRAGDPDSTSPIPGLLVGLKAAGQIVGPTMTVIPEACQLGQNDYAAVVQAMLAQAGTLQDRMAILDLPGALEGATVADLQAAQANLWTAIAPQVANFSYGCVYAPALNATVVTTDDVLFTRLRAAPPADNRVINNILTTQAYADYAGAQLGSVQAAIAAAFPLTAVGVSDNTAQYSGDASAYPPPTAQTPATLAQWRQTLTTLLNGALPVFAQIQGLIAADMNIAPPSAALAGLWTTNDAQTGIWNAPANVAVAAIADPLCPITDAQQGGFNLPLNGQAIDIVRYQPNRGSVVWGARTLDGNSGDCRYIQVRRTLIYIEQSIKTGLGAYVFAANENSTWVAVTTAISNFLTGLWQQGGLLGDKASDAFTVACGLGSTMTGQDILDGKMKVAVTVQMIHPAEFITLNFTQTMGS